MSTSGVIGFFHQLLWWADHVVLVYFLLLNSFYALLLLLSIPELWRHWRIAGDEHMSRLLSSDALPALSLLVPAYNEEVTVTSSALSFLTLAYPTFEVILINDGSKDRTIDVLTAEFDLYEVPPAYPKPLKSQRVRAVYRSRRHSRLVVIDKENGGKADSLNAGMNAARHQYVVAVDADTLIEPDALMRLTRPFLLGASVAAVGGTLRVANGCEVRMGRVIDPRVDPVWLTGCQVVEYLRAFLFGRLGWNTLGGSLIISGAFGLFKREYLIAIGGYKTGNVTEDMDLVVRLQRYLYDNGIKAELPFIPDPVAWTEVPSDRKVLARQRERWHRGLIGTMVTHRDLLFNRKYGVMGMVAIPYFLFGEMLAPAVELLGYVMTLLGLSLGAVDGRFALLFLLCAVGYGTLLSFWAIVLEEVSFKRYRRKSDTALLLFFGLIEGLGYRQLTVWYRLQAFWKFMKKSEDWGVMTRKGFGAPAAK